MQELARRRLVRRLIRSIGARLGLQFVGELTELVEIDARPESKGMRDRLRRPMACRYRLARCGGERSIDGLVAGKVKLARQLFPEARKIIAMRRSFRHDAEN